MGATYYLANTTKKQYFDPDDVGGSENSKRSGVLWGLSGHALAQLLLPDGALDFCLQPWIGDSLVLVGDGVEPNAIEQLNAFQQAPDQDAYHIVTEQFDNISLNLIAQLCKRDTVLDHFLDHANGNNGVFVNLAHIIMYLDARHIERPFVARFGPEWRARYDDTLKSHPWHCPMPMTLESKRTPPD